MTEHVYLSKYNIYKSGGTTKERKHNICSCHLLEYSWYQHGSAPYLLHIALLPYVRGSSWSACLKSGASLTCFFSFYNAYLLLKYFIFIFSNPLSLLFIAESFSTSMCHIHLINLCWILCFFCANQVPFFLYMWFTSSTVLQSTSCFSSFDKYCCISPALMSRKVKYFLPDTVSKFLNCKLCLLS